MNAFSVLNPAMSLSGFQTGVHEVHGGGDANRMLNFGSHLILT